MSKVYELSLKFAQAVGEAGAAAVAPTENKDIEMIKGTMRALEKLRSIYSKLQCLTIANNYDDTRFFSSTDITDADKAKYCKQISEDIKNDFRVLGIR